MAQDLPGVAVVEQPTKNVVVDVRIITSGVRPTVSYTQEGSVPLQESNDLGKPMYRKAAASWRYTRHISDPAVVTQLLSEATARILQGTGAVDVYTGIEETAGVLEARLGADEVVAPDDLRKLRDLVGTRVEYGEELMTQFGIPY